MKCKHCGKPMLWKQDRKGRWIPMNADGTKHDCVSMGKAARRRAWLREHAASMRQNAILNREFRKITE